MDSNSISIDDVILPNWVEGDSKYARAFDFIYKKADLVYFKTKGICVSRYPSFHNRFSIELINLVPYYTWILYPIRELWIVVFNGYAFITIGKVWINTDF